MGGEVGGVEFAACDVFQQARGVFPAVLLDKVCLITGANSGIGKATALGLAQMGATIVMVCRDRARGEEAQREIKMKSGNEAVDLLIADLSARRLMTYFATLKPTVRTPDQRGSES